MKYTQQDYENFAKELSTQTKKTTKIAELNLGGAINAATNTLQAILVSVRMRGEKTHKIFGLTPNLIGDIATVKKLLKSMSDAYEIYNDFCLKAIHKIQAQMLKEWKSSGTTMQDLMQFKELLESLEQEFERKIKAEQK